MSNTGSNSLRDVGRQAAVLLTLLLILLSSCTIKGGIKSFAGIPVNTEHTAQQNEYVSPNGSNTCAEILTGEPTIIPKGSFQAQALMPTVLLAASFLTLFSLPAISKEKQHPFYNSSSKIRHAVPLFLEYRKLLLPQ